MKSARTDRDESCETPAVLRRLQSASRKSSPQEFPPPPFPARRAWAYKRSEWPRSSHLRLGRGPPAHLHYRRHADISVADGRAPPTAHARHGKFADEVVRQFAEEAPVAPVVNGAPRV